MRSALAHQKVLAETDHAPKVRRKAVRWSASALTAEDQRESRRRALLMQAGRAFAARGFHNTTLDDIAQSLNVTKAALYRYVKGKQELLYELHDIAAKIAEDALAAAHREARDPIDIVRLYARYYMQDLTGELGSWAMLLERSAMLPEHERSIQRRRRIVDAQLRAAVTDAMEKGLVPAGDPKLVVFYIHGAINWLYSWYRDQGAEAREHVIEQFVAYSMAVLRSGGQRSDPSAVPPPPTSKQRARA